MARAASLIALALALPGCTAILTYPTSDETGALCGNRIDDDFDRLVDDADPGCGHLALPCDSDATCGVMVCGALENDQRVCTPRCSAETSCPAGWRCGTEGTCTCLASCVEHCNGRDDDCDGNFDEDTCAVGETCTAGACTCDGQLARVLSGDVDVLFVIDDTADMAEEQAALRAEIPRFIGALTSGDRDGDGTRDLSPVDSLHIGVVTSDMGSGAATMIVSCDPGFGDDGVLQTGDASCGGAPTGIFEFRATSGAPDVFAAQVDCGMRVGTAGCGFEQLLEPALLALSPERPSDAVRDDYVPPTFGDGTMGHGDGPNRGFLRPNSLLAILLVSSEEDCSTDHSEIFSHSDPRYDTVDLNLRCHEFPDQVQPISRYIEGFLQLRRDPSQVVFAAITGVPTSAGEMRLLPTQMLALPEMQEVVAPTGQGLLPSCTAPGHGVAYPARRIVSVAEGIECAGGYSSITSICQPTFTDAFDYLIDQIAGNEEHRVCIHPR